MILGAICYFRNKHTCNFLASTAAVFSGFLLPFSRTRKTFGKMISFLVYKMQNYMVKSKSRVTDILGSKTRPIMIGSYNIAYLELFFCSYNHLYIHQTGLYPVFGKPKFLQRKKLQASSIQRKKKETEEAANYPGFYLHRIIGSQNIKKNNRVLILATRFSKPSKITCIVKTRLSY